MDKDLKAQNALPLTAIYVGTFVLAALTHWGAETVFAFTDQLGQQALIVAAVTAFGGALSHMLPNGWKHPLVYWRLRNVLSGHRCRRICEKDQRLRSSDLERRWPVLFLRGMEESEQNSYWYNEIYRSVRKEPEVLQAHRSFLLYRDAATGIFLLLLCLLLWKALGEVLSVKSVSIWSAWVLGGTFALVSSAARQSGDRMVANSVAVALETSESAEGG